MRHPIAAYNIGTYKPGATNISTNSTRFSTNIGLNEDKETHKGSQVNAFRHTLWQATIRNKFGTAIAQQAGNAHEENPRVNLAIRNFKGEGALSKADQTIDLLNNQIGREIGKNNPNASPQELAVKTLDYFHDKGLYTSETNKDGSVSVSQTKISDSQYNNAMGTLKNMDDNGRSKK